ncbi:MAG: tRNA pseudouridine(55) synthase TruB, partial [Chlamydiota bacterium]
KLSDSFLGQDKAYQTTVVFGSATTTYDQEGSVTEESSHIPTLEDVQLAISAFQGTIWQEPPMFSAKKVGGKKLCDLARKGITIERKPCQVTVAITLLNYAYPLLELEISCSKGTYIRSLGHDIGKRLGCFGHLKALRRTKSGNHHVAEALDGSLLFKPDFSENDLKRSSFCDMIPINL